MVRGILFCLVADVAWCKVTLRAEASKDVGDGKNVVSTQDGGLEGTVDDMLRNSRCFEEGADVSQIPSPSSQPGLNGTHQVTQHNNNNNNNNNLFYDNGEQT